MDTLVKAYPNIFPQGSEEGGTDGPAGEDTADAEAGEGDAPDTFTAKWGWISLIDTVSDTKRCSWDDVWKETMLETLNVFAYAKDRNARREDELERYKRTH